MPVRSGGFLGGLSARRRAVVVAAVLLVAGLVAALLVPRLADRLGSGLPAIAAQDRPGTVLLVPGYGGGTGALQSLADRIRATGRTATVVPLPGDGTGDLRVQAAALDARGHAMPWRPGADSVDVVGYSAGGVVARLWVQRVRRQRRARRIVTLGSPHHGARIAAVGRGSGARRLPDRVPAAGAGQRSARRTAVAGADPAGVAVGVDVARRDGARRRTRHGLTGAVNVALQSVCPTARVGHGGLPTDPTVTALVLRALGPRPLAAPTRAAERAISS